MNNETTRIERALLSVSNKASILEFARGLASLGVEILSTGGTSSYLKQHGLTVVDISDYTGFPEMFDGRVKTLHPKVHGGLLQRRNNDDHAASAKKYDIPRIDLVAVNLYPFAETIAKPGVMIEEAIENIDIGGPSMLRSAAKNHQWVTVVCDPVNYQKVLHEMRGNDGNTTLETRQRLAREVFKHTGAYDTLIGGYMSEHYP